MYSVLLLLKNGPFVRLIGVSYTEYPLVHLISCLLFDNALINVKYERNLLLQADRMRVKNTITKQFTRGTFVLMLYVCSAVADTGSGVWTAHIDGY